MQTMSNLLSLAIWIPVAFGILLLAIGRQENAGVTRWIALIGSVIGFLVTIPVMTHFDGFQRGVIDLRDVAFFASVIGFALFTTGVIIRSQRAG